MKKILKKIIKIIQRRLYGPTGTELVRQDKSRGC
jgi:hypothetical protein